MYIYTENLKILLVPNTPTRDQLDQSLAVDGSLGRVDPLRVVGALGRVRDHPGLIFDTVSELKLVIQMLVPSNATPFGLKPVG